MCHSLKVNVDVKNTEKKACKRSMKISQRPFIIKGLYLLLVFSLLISSSLACSLGNSGSSRNSSSDLNNKEKPSLNKYMMFMFTNKHVDEIEDYLPEMKTLYGEIDEYSPHKYAFGVIGPMLLTQSIEEMQHVIEKGFDYAVKYNIPVYFQLDDVNNYTKYYGYGAETKFYEDPEMVEWVDFPVQGEEWGGQNRYGALPAYWLNWGIWMRSPAFPNLASEKFKAWIGNNLQKGVIEPLMRRYGELVDEDKDYLFAGLAIGWETHIPDYSKDNNILYVEANNLPRESVEGKEMQPFELAKYGYGALYSLGYDEEKLAAEAKEAGKGVDNYRRQLLYGVIHDFSEFMAKNVYDAGIPRTKIFTHMVSFSTTRVSRTTFAPPTWAAVNEYSIPGFTMSPVTCPYDMEILKEEIAEVDPNMPYFGNVEGYAAGLEDEKSASKYLDEMFDNGALLVSVYSYADMGTRLFHFSRSPDFGFNKAVIKWLDKGTKSSK